MEVRLLGQVDVWRGGRQLPLGRRQQRLILGILALEANHVVSCDRLIELLWGDRAPVRVRAAMQTRVSELRSILAADTELLATDEGDDQSEDPEQPLVKQGDGYVLHLPATAVDLHTFRNLVTDAQSATSDTMARDLLHTALKIWRGPALGGALAGEPHAALCHSLDSARLTALEDLFDIELRLGNQHVVVDRIVQTFGANPDRERLARLALSALGRTGRNAEAITTYDQWRRWLADELGIDPSQEIQQLYLAILNGNGERAAPILEPADLDVRAALPPTAPSPVPCTLPPDVSDFTGRDGEVADIVELLSRRDGARPPVVALSGRGGVGKTALTVHVAHRVRDEFPDGQLFADLRGVGDEDPARASDVLGRLLRALGVDGRTTRHSLDERIDVYRGLLADKRVLVVLDNAASDDQIAPLLPSGAGCAVLVNGRTRLGATFGAPAFPLDVLPPTQATRLLSSIVGPERVSDDLSAALALAEACGHLPLALRVAGAKLAAKPHWSIRKLLGMLADERGKLDQFSYGQLDVRTSIALSYADLDDDLRLLLRRLGDMELPDVSVFGAAALMDSTPHEVEILLERLVDAQLIDFAEHDAAGRPRYRMHDLVRLFAAERARIEDSPEARAAARDRVVGCWLRACDDMHRHIYGGVYKNIGADTPRHDIDESLAEVLATEPLRWFETERKNLVATVRRAAKDGQATAAWELAAIASPLFQIRRQLDDWWAMLTCAMTAARQAGDDRGQAAMHYRMGQVRADRTDYQGSWQQFQDARRMFTELDDRHGAAAADAFAGMIERIWDRNDDAEQRYRRCLPVLRESGDTGFEAYIMRSLGQIRAARRDFEGAADHYAKAMAIYRAIGGRQGQAQTLFWQAMMYVEQGRYAGAEAGFEEALAISRRLFDRGGEAQCLRGLGLCYRRMGKRLEADATLSEALRLVRQRQPTHMEIVVQETIASVS